MFREMRRKERQLSAEAALAILEKCSWGTLSTVGEDGWPYGVPVNYAVIGNSLYFHCAKTGHKLDNISHCDKVSFTAVTRSDVLSEQFSTDFESAIAFGRATGVTGEEKIRALTAIITKYSPDFMESGAAYIARAADATQVVRMDIEHITGKARSKS